MYKCVNVHVANHCFATFRVKLPVGIKIIKKTGSQVMDMNERDLYLVSLVRYRKVSFILS